jgi:hypothetical protein
VTNRLFAAAVALVAILSFGRIARAQIPSVDAGVEDAGPDRIEIDAAPPPAPEATPPVAATPVVPPAVEPTEEPTPTKKKKNVESRSIPGDAWGDEPGGTDVGGINVRILLQSRYATTYAPLSTNPQPGYAVRENWLARQGDGWSVHRFFVRLGAEPSELIGFKGILDFAELIDDNADSMVKQAYATVRPVPKHLKFVTGLFKLPFSILELDPIAKYEFADLGQADDLIKDLGFGGRDFGAEVIASPFSEPDLLHLTVGAFRGNNHDENALFVGALGARAESHPVKGLRLGVDVVDHPRAGVYQRPFDTKNKHVLPNPPDPFFPTQKDWAKGRAWSADVTFERWHFDFRAEGMFGDRVDADETYGAKTFVAAWALASYRFHAGPLHLMPAVRAEWLDGNREAPIGVRRELSFALSWLISKNARLMFDVTRTDVEPGSPILDQPLPLQSLPYLELNSTRLVGQFQAEL